MSGFLTELEVEPFATSDAYWQLTAPLVYASDILGATVTIPDHFYTDLASIPLGIKWAHREGVLHDYLYRSDSVPQATFRQANQVIFEAMLSRGKGFFTRWVIFSGVTVGGWWSYHRKSVDWVPLGVTTCVQGDLPCEPTAPVPVQTVEEKANEVH